MVSKRRRPQRANLKVTAENYQTVLLEVLRIKNAGNLKRLSNISAKLGIVDPDTVPKLTNGQWEEMMYKLISVNPSLTKEEREEGKNWCISRGLYPGGGPENDW